MKATRAARRRGRLAVVALGLAAAASIAVAPTASAVPGQTSSTGLRCGGLISCGPFAQSNFPAGPATNTLASANVAGLVTTGVINTTANAGGATASVANVNATLSGLSTLTATAVSSECTVNSTTGAVTGSSSIAGGSIAVLGGSPITLATAPAPNTNVTVVDPAVASVVLNRQTTAADGTLTVDAIFITLLNSQTITIATSTCGPALLPIPVVAPAVAIGGGLALAIAAPVMGAIWYRRRQVTAAGANA
ncbi:choice-of-anchor P family protein [Knoellia sp. CPCC 206453]|uniref:choice-of-anchor P family protein n=1 Tax=Knoellia pratensis TaxID=3404796 RepID=UPI00360AD2FF